MKKHEYDKILFRLIEIWRRLRNGEALVKKELAKEFNVSERTIQKDFNERLMSFLPIERIGKEYRVKKGYSLDKNLNFENELVVNILESISSSMGKKMSQMSKNLFKKLYNPREDFILSKMQIEDLGECIDKVKQIQDSIVNCKEISFYYNGKDRVARAYKIAIFEGFWYLYAQDRNDNRFKTFYIKNIEKLSTKDTVFEIDFNMLEKLDNALNIWFEPDGENFEVVLLANKNISKYFKRRSIGKYQKILNEFEDGSIKLSIVVSSKRAILHEVKKWLPDLLIISPEYLKQDMLSLIDDFRLQQATFSV